MNTIYFKAIGKRSRYDLYDFINVFKGHCSVELNFNRSIESINQPTHDIIEVDVMVGSLKIKKLSLLYFISIYIHFVSIGSIDIIKVSAMVTPRLTLVPALHFPRGGAVVEGCERW